jgi:hypothetical protein
MPAQTYGVSLPVVNSACRNFNKTVHIELPHFQCKNLCHLISFFVIIKLLPTNSAFAKVQRTLISRPKERVVNHEQQNISLFPAKENIVHAEA